MQFPRVMPGASLLWLLAFACTTAGGSKAEDENGDETGGGGDDGKGGGEGGAEAAAGTDGAERPGAPTGSGGGTGGKPDAGASPDAVPGAPDAAGARARRSAGCGKAGTGTGSYTRQTVTIAGAERTYFVWVPRGYDPERAYPVVFYFHGTGGVAPGNGRGIELKAGTEAILVGGQGIDGLWQLGGAGVDVAFFDAMLKDVTTKRCVDQRRVFAMGFSRGGAMSNLLGCVRGDVIRAIGPLAAWQPARVRDCVGHPSAWFAHGKADDVVPLDQGVRARDLLVAHNGCNPATTAVAPSPCVEQTMCGHDTKLVWCAIEGGHGEVIDYADPVIWDFFKQFD